MRGIHARPDRVVSYPELMFNPHQSVANSGMQGIYSLLKKEPARSFDRAGNVAFERVFIAFRLLALTEPRILMRGKSWPNIGGHDVVSRRGKATCAT